MQNDSIDLTDSEDIEKDTIQESMKEEGEVSLEEHKEVEAETDQKILEEVELTQETTEKVKEVQEAEKDIELVQKMLEEASQESQGVSKDTAIVQEILEEESSHHRPSERGTMQGHGRSRKRKSKEFWSWKPIISIEGFFKPSDGLWAAFCIPILVMIIIFIQRGIFPFGEQSFLRTDMYHQYAPFFSEFQYKLNEEGSLFYSWNIGMGVNFSALYAYYLASPVNWLLYFCPKELVIEFMTYGIVLKIGLAGLTFAFYLKKHFGRDDFGIGFFGIFYALSGYMAAYSWNIMWLDCILLFPLIMLGLEQLVKKQEGMLYCITLGVSILSNYYISIMTCLFMVIYFGVLLIMGTGQGKRLADYGIHIRQFTIYSLLAGGLAAVVLIPEIYALQMTASADTDFPKTVSSYFSIFDMFARHIGNVETEIGLDHWPNLYCGVTVLIFFLLYLGCTQIQLKEKVVYCGLLLLFFASFSVNILNFIWHGFHFPNSLPCRQSFIYIFLMLVICYRAYSNLDRIPWRQVVTAFWGAIIFVLLAEKLVEEKDFEFYTFYIAIVFLAFYGGLLYLYKKKLASYGMIMALALGLVSIESALNTTVTSVTTTSRTSYIKDNEDVKLLIDSLISPRTFYRIEKVTRKTKNDGAWMNFPSVSLFSSTANASLTDFFKALGCEGNTNAYSITGSTPLVDSLFSVRYGLYSSPQDENDLLEFMGQSEDTFLYRRKATLPVGFLVSSDLERDWQRDLGNPVEVQNQLCDAIGAQRVLLEAEGENYGGNFRFTPIVDGDYYVYISNKKVKEVKVSIGEEIETFKNVNRGFLLELGICQAGTEITITNEENNEGLNAKAYRFSNEGLLTTVGILGRCPLKVTRWKDTKLEGDIWADQEGMLFTSIPYDKGWTVKVDGIQQESRKIFDTFLSVEIPEGSHTISFSYEPEGLRLGAGITLLSILCLYGIFWITHREERELKRKQELEKLLAEIEKL